MRVAFVPAPHPPSDLATRTWGADTVELSWNPGASAASARTNGYRVEWSPTGEGDWNDLIDNTGSTDTTFFDTGVSANTMRYYRVSAVSRVGDSTPSEAAAATTRPVEVDVEVAADTGTVLHVGRSSLTFSPESWATDFSVRASAQAANCGEPDGDGATPGTALECGRVETIADDGGPAEGARLLRPMQVRIELSPVLIAESGGLAELYRHYLNGDLRLLVRDAHGAHWREHSFRFSVDGTRPVSASVKINRIGDFALVYSGSGAE